MYCKKCGKETSENTKFCVYCGTPVESGSNAQPGTVGAMPYSIGAPTNYQKRQRMLIGKKADYYQRRFQGITARNSKISWNWAAFFLSLYWCFYRKMYKVGAILVGILYLCGFIPGIGPMIGGVAVSIVCGILGNSFYKNYLDEKILSAAEMGLTDEIFGYYALEKGQTSLASSIILGMLMSMANLMVQLYFSMVVGNLLGEFVNNLLY